MQRPDTQTSLLTGGGLDADKLHREQIGDNVSGRIPISCLATVQGEPLWPGVEHRPLAMMNFADPKTLCLACGQHQ